MNIREGKSSEHIQIMKLVTALFPHSTIEIRASDTMYVAVEKKELVGFVHVKVDKNIVIVKGIGVLPHYQKKGIGSGLLEHVKSVFGSKEIRLKVKVSNSATQVYHKAGMVPVKYEGDVCVVAYKKNT